MKEKIIEKIKKEIDAKEFECDSFDLVVNDKFIVKIVEDAHSLNKNQIENLQKISKFLNLFPLIISNKFGGKNLETDIVYLKNNLPILNPETFIEYLKGKKINRISRKGGKYYIISFKRLEEIRKKRNMSIKEFCEYLGISKTMYWKYKKGAYTKIELSKKLEEEVFENFEVDIIKRDKLEIKMERIGILPTFYLKSRSLSYLMRYGEEKFVSKVVNNEKTAKYNVNKLIKFSDLDLIPFIIIKNGRFKEEKGIKIIPFSFFENLEDGEEFVSIFE